MLRQRNNVRCVAKIAYRPYGKFEFVAGRDPGFDRPLDCFACDYGYEGDDCTCSHPGWVVGIYEPADMHVRVHPVQEARPDDEICTFVHADCGYACEVCGRRTLAQWCGRCKMCSYREDTWVPRGATNA